LSTDAHPLGLASGRVIIMPYDPRWVVEFQNAERELRLALGSAALAVHHVGSTAVPGLCAKPVLDLLVSVPDLAASLQFVSKLEAIDYEFRPHEDISDRHFFRRRRGAKRTHHLSLAEPTSHFHKATLAFRDALRQDPAKAREYAELKLMLARRFPGDREKYLEGKTAFVARVLREPGLEHLPDRTIPACGDDTCSLK